MWSYGDDYIIYNYYIHLQNYPTFYHRHPIICQSPFYQNYKPIMTCNHSFDDPSYHRILQIRLNQFVLPIITMVFTLKVRAYMLQTFLFFFFDSNSKIMYFYYGCTYEIYIYILFSFHNIQCMLQSN